MDNNPLRQYFRRPAVYIKLPSLGKDYRPGVIDFSETGELPVYPMTAIDEITVRTPDALFNGTALAELIKSCIPAIKDPWQVSSNDMDSILIAIKIASGNEVTEILSECPECQEPNNVGINLTGVLGTLKAGDYDSTLELGELSIRFKPITYKIMNDAALGQFELQRTFAQLEGTDEEVARNKITKAALENLTFLTMKILSQSIEYIKTPTAEVREEEFILDFLKSCGRTEYATIRDTNAKIRESTEVKPAKIECESCKHQYEQAFSISPSDFFE